MKRAETDRSGLPGRLVRRIAAVGIAAAALGALTTAPAWAGDGRHGGHGKGGWHKPHHAYYGHRGPRHYGPRHHGPRVYYAPPPRVYYVPPPRVYYAPPPVYYEPPSISFVIPLNIR